MTDTVCPQVRSRMMASVRRESTKPERVVRSFLHRKGLRFRLHPKDLPGSPDIVLPRFRSVVFVHGCFWHQHAGCSKGRLPETRREFWRKKLTRNTTRDHEAAEALQALGWSFVILGLSFCIIYSYVGCKTGCWNGK